MDKTFYKAFGDGQLKTQSALSLLNPFNPAWSRIRAANKNVKDHNVLGEGTILGGVLVVRQGEGGVGYMHSEQSFGDFPSISELLAAAKAAVA